MAFPTQTRDGLSDQDNAWDDQLSKLIRWNVFPLTMDSTEFAQYFLVDFETAQQCNAEMRQ